jgi:hypothetical protein
LLLEVVEYIEWRPEKDIFHSRERMNRSKEPRARGRPTVLFSSQEDAIVIDVCKSNKGVYERIRCEAEGVFLLFPSTK